MKSNTTRAHIPVRTIALGNTRKGLWRDRTGRTGDSHSPKMGKRRVVFPLGPQRDESGLNREAGGSPVSLTRPFRNRRAAAVGGAGWGLAAGPAIGHGRGRTGGTNGFDRRASVR